MDPSLIAGLASGIASIGGSLAQNQTNQAQMFYNDLQYQRQRKDALSDWNMQNEYNSPKAQMARFKDAGLNPNLIYGQMTNSPVVRSSEMSNAHLAPVNPTGALAEGMSKYFDTKLQQQQVDNLKKQNDVLTQDVLLKTAEVLGKGYANKKMALELEKQPELLQTTLDGLKANVRKTLIESNIATDVNKRQQELHQGNLNIQPVNLRSAVQKIANEKSLNALTHAQRQEVLERVKTIKNSGVLQKLDIELKKKGLQPGDAPWLRIPAQLMGTEPVQKVYKRIIDGIKRSGVPGR